MDTTVILADGDFPVHTVPLSILKSSPRIVCCDGAAEALLKAGLEPFSIVGDCDSVNKSIAEKYNDRLYRIAEQETNDLTKSVKWCAERGFNDLIILGGTGKREDHTLGNISLLADYALTASVKMVSDHGIFYPVLKNSSFEVEKGRQVSIFSPDPETEIYSEGLLYPLNGMKLRSWWQATLNEATGDSFSLRFTGGPLIVFLAF